MVVQMSFYTTEKEEVGLKKGETDTKQQVNHPLKLYSVERQIYQKGGRRAYFVSNVIKKMTNKSLSCKATTF